MSECCNWLVWAWKSTKYWEAKSLSSDSLLQENLQVPSKCILCIPIVCEDKSLMQLLKFSFEFKRYRSVLSSSGQGFKPANDFWGILRIYGRNQPQKFNIGEFSVIYWKEIGKKLGRRKTFLPLKIQSLYPAVSENVLLQWWKWWKCHMISMADLTALDKPV